MKKVLLMMSVLLSVGMFCACSSDDDAIGERHIIPVPMPGDVIPTLSMYNGCLYSNYVLIYEPVSDEELPEWFKPYLNPEKPCNYQLYQGEYNGNIIYDLQSCFYSLLGPHLYDKDGKKIERGDDAYDDAFKISTWKLIYVENQELGIVGNFPL